jgi:EpsI family protein
MTNRTFFTIVSILFISAILSLKSYLPSRLANSQEIQVSNFPTVIGDWKSQDAQLPERDYEILETKNLIIRDYINSPEVPINLYIIYSKDNRKVGHPPEICLQGAGETVVYKSSIIISGAIKAIELITQKGLSKEMVVYWYKVGKFNTTSYLLQQIKQVTDRLFGRNTSVAMIRMLTRIENNDEESALTRIKKFYMLIDNYVP